MQFMLDLNNIIPADLDIFSALLFIGVFGLAVMLAGILIRLIIGKNSGLNQALSSALGILLIYVVTVLIYTFNPGDLSQYLSPLPFVSFSGEKLVLFSFLNSGFSAICRELLSMVILAFLANLIDSFIPEGKRMFSWFILRLVTVLAAMALHYFTNQLFETYIPGILSSHAPMILFCVLVFMLLLGIAKVILGIFLTVVNPIFGALYTFFFSSKIGKQLSKALLSTILLSAFVIALEYLGYGVIAISLAALQSYIPALMVIFILWYVTRTFL